MDNIFITYQRALELLESQIEDFPTESKALKDCVGAYLAEDLHADRDFPPFDRVTMDGIAISFSSFESGRRQFKIEAISPAGSPQLVLQNPDNCIEVMTGTIVPEKADTVIRYEDLSIQNGVAHLQSETITHRQSIHFKGSDRAQGALMVKKGRQLSSAEINIAAAVGKPSLLVKKLPDAVIFSTGDELVDVDESPEIHQIRRSNVYGIRNTLKEWGIQSELQHLPDEKSEMERVIAKYLKSHQILFFTGGVSKGKYDFLPEVLEALQVKRLFHKVQQRPGKPFWFGTALTGAKIFALPGNPVSSFVCLYVYFQYWLRSSLGLNLNFQYVKLLDEISFKPDLVYFLEAKLESQTDGTLAALPLPGNGSGDFANLVNADGFLILPQNKTLFKKGEVYPFLHYRQVF
ncbi:molybdopterin molybdotransferase MoeA [Poritiphilus flavus]|uniref:Molybdopterin molybdenumtransferase n=1 Tax=Poritiphilus flavus TaxID=2697053 RepID=A0A6L9EEX7_9FLAO|nr:molybdopterin molybdotransferase MoeA [Poritiphilus flavus]NAS13221.1 molybdopterin molybdenumtransferase MoeA [Poritiphilus flavus]